MGTSPVRSPPSASRRICSPRKVMEKPSERRVSPFSRLTLSPASSLPLWVHSEASFGMNSFSERTALRSFPARDTSSFGPPIVKYRGFSYQVPPYALSANPLTPFPSVSLFQQRSRAFPASRPPSRSPPRGDRPAGQGPSGFPCCRDPPYHRSRMGAHCPRCSR